MSEFPDFSPHGYQIERELGQNYAGGRVTYLATNKNTQPVVIKEFQFARSGASWANYDAYQREIQVLQQLDHPNIPRYLDSFETATGFCLVQEYKKAPSLAQQYQWKPKEIEQIAVAVLKILIYLQKQAPPVIHRDIKPENILVDREGELKVYLVDFGFAHIGSGQVAVSSVVKGTLGFMPPEQLFNHQLTSASDLYSLGATLICLLTGTQSTEVGKLVDESYRLNFKLLVPKLNLQFVAWLENITAPNVKQRYPNAASALAALLPLKVYKDNSYNKKNIPLVLAGIAISVLLLPGLTYLSKVNQNSSSKQAIARTSQPMASQEASSKELLKQRLLETRQCPGCDLSNVDLSMAHLAGADLSRSNLSGAMLRGANLAGANLARANLRGTAFQSANLVGANLNEADLTNAGLGANLTNASLQWANLTGAGLISAELFGADLFRAKLNKAVLRSANLTSAELQGADLTEADLIYANLSGALLNGARLTHTTMPDGSIHP